ncbi:sensor histidine kinase [Azospirillum picis]|uniref:histidine kinase n=1 Tax=Azospirillum picis TaxID=488438 RepID=A0ABU0MTS8_9PROT|nr:HAMP domain-containing sensor histidine kinase [Azospirillum picis]MBP2303060.1 signal transduction histidine kinase [Azospirillum picis]MDQ0536826.1 signal transduction histidine kinase [Azospirillum picis]
MLGAVPNLRPLIAAINMTAIGAVFLFDAVTPADNVSVCFAYTIPIVLSILEGGRRTMAYTACAIVLTALGSFIQPPDDRISLVFVANRLIAAFTLCMMALLVRYRLAIEAGLQAMLDRQREQTDRQRRFIRMLSHEVRTPLTVMDGHAYRLIKRGPALSADEVQRRAQTIRTAAARIDGVIASVLTMSAMGTEQMAPTLRPVDLRTLLDGLAQAASEGGTVISCDLDRLPGHLDADPLLLTQAFENLIGNAIKYAPAASPITVSGACEEGEAVVRITDRGSGIAPPDLPQVFTPYFRGANSRNVPGAGIGLHLVSCVIAAHGGTVSLDSRVGQGTTATIRLPLRSPSTPS